MSEEKTVSGMKSPAHEESFPSGKDETQQLTAVREAWIEYQVKEKQFSKDLALALINLHDHLAKPGHGSFWKHVKTLKIPRMHPRASQGRNGSRQVQGTQVGTH